MPYLVCGTLTAEKCAEVPSSMFLPWTARSAIGLKEGFLSMDDTFTSRAAR